MGLMKDFLITIHNGGDEAVAAVQRMGEDWRAMLEQAAAEIERRWIPVTERLPDEGQEVLVASPCPNSAMQNIDIASWSEEGQQGPVWREADCGRIKPTHWMPLPAPPTDAK